MGWRGEASIAGGESSVRKTPGGTLQSLAGACAGTAAVFTELQVPPGAALVGTSGVEVVLAGERLLRVERDFDEDTFRRALAVLESLPC